MDKEHKNFKIIFHLQLLDGSKIDMVFHNISRTNSNKIIYKFQDDNVGTKILYDEFIWLD